MPSSDVIEINGRGIGRIDGASTGNNIRVRQDDPPLDMGIDNTDLMKRRAVLELDVRSRFPGSFSGCQAIVI